MLEIRRLVFGKFGVGKTPEANRTVTCPNNRRFLGRKRLKTIFAVENIPQKYFSI